MEVERAIDQLLNAKADEDTSSWWDLILSDPDEGPLAHAQPPGNEPRATAATSSVQGAPTGTVRVPLPTRAPSPPPLALITPPRRRTVPAVGSRIQRSGNQGERKLMALAGLPPPPSTRRHIRPPAAVRPASWACAQITAAPAAGKLDPPASPPRKLKIIDDEILIDKVVLRTPPGRPGLPAPAPGLQPPTAARSSAKRAPHRPTTRPTTAAPRPPARDQEAPTAAQPPPTAPPAATAAPDLPVAPTIQPAGPPATAQALRSPGTRVDPPPIRVTIAPGRTVDVPFQAAHQSRRYRAQLADGRWILRFTRQGILRSANRVV